MHPSNCESWSLPSESLSCARRPYPALSLLSLPPEILALVLSSSSPLNLMLLRSTCSLLLTLSPPPRLDEVLLELARVGDVPLLRSLWGERGRVLLLQSPPCLFASVHHHSLLTWLAEAEDPSPLLIPCAEGGPLTLFLRLLPPFPSRPSFALVEAAARGGNLAVLNHLAFLRLPLNQEAPLFAAAEGGHEAALDLLLSHGAALSEGTLAAAARGGHVSLVMRIREEGCGWDSTATCEAARGGHNDLLHYLLQAGCPVDEQAAVVAAEGGHVKVLRELKTWGAPWSTPLLLVAGARGGHLLVLSFLYSILPSEEVFLPDPEPVLTAAAEAGHLEVLSWLISHLPYPFTLPLRPAYVAARHGHLPALRLLVESGAPLSPLLCAAAAHGGHLSLLRWLRGRGTPWDRSTWKAALVHPKGELSIYLEEEGCPRI